jgi:hypothetical protein
LPDVNVLLAMGTESHVHHALVNAWFDASPKLPWALCAFTEAGFLRVSTAPHPGQISMHEAKAVLETLSRHRGYRYQPITADWQTLLAPIQKRLYGTKQVTDAFLLGLAVREDLVLVTMDRGILHLAGAEHSKHVLLLQPQIEATN